VIRPYYVDNFGTDLTVDLVLYDASANITTNETEAVTREYTITLWKLLEGVTATRIVAVRNTNALITAYSPQEVQVSSMPLRGNF